VSAPYDHESRYFAKDVLALDRCAYCSAPVDCIDHVEPKAGGGPDHWSNFTGACRFCNGSKGASPLLQFLLRKTARQGIWDFVPPGQATR
jgi:5-methylcytosine-specific restriction endonuclease McrA